ILTSEDDFVDSAYFQLQVREPEENVPTGPDDYGYSCFDDTDDDWELAPAYEWIEICPEENDADFEGTLIDFEGDSEHDIGEAIVIDLGYTLVFYGQEYDQITVATNGFICVGEQERIVNFENWPLDRCIGGGMGMIAPFWDDLQLDDGGIYYFHDENTGRFIVEWYDMRHLTDANEELTFQVVLYDGNMWPTVSGDDKILFQYRSIANAQNERGGDDEWLDGIPYASVGISSPDGSTGINYTWNNQYPISAAPLEPRRALFFTTALFDAHEGSLSGRVTDAANEAGLADVIVATQIGQNTISDEDGFWQIDSAFTGFEFDLTFSLEGYNDSVVVDLFLDEMEELTVNVALLHPEFEPSQWSFVRHLMPDMTSEIDFTVENTGNGPLDWELSRHLPWEGSDADPWELRLSYAVSDSVADARVEGVIFAYNCFYVSGANVNGNGDGENMIYVLDRDGHEIDRFPQLGESRYGMRDLAWDGELIWGCVDNMVYAFTTDGDSVTAFEGPEYDLSSIAWDSDREVLWMARRTGRGIYAVNRGGDEVDSLRLPRFDLRIYGLAYWRDAPDDSKLYIYHSPDNQTSMVYKVNPENQDTTYVRTLEHEEGGSPRGVFCTNTFDVYSWVFMCISDNNAQDRIDIWQLDARRDWFRVFMETDTGRVVAEHGRIDAEEIQEYTLRLSSDDLPELVEFNGFLLFRHDTTGRPPDTLYVLLEVVSVPYSEFSLLTPADGDTLWENPSYDTTLVTFGWEQLIDYVQDEDVSYQVCFRSGGDSVMIESGEDTTLILEMIELTEDLGLPIEEEWLLEWYVLAALRGDTIQSRETFTLLMLPDVVLDSDGAVPVEFGLRSIYPSPFNSMTTISFGIDVEESTKLQVFDLAGRKVVTLLDRTPSVGYHSVVWDASAFPSGLYLIRLESLGRVQTAKVALIR
ncbi:MAG: T9SS type A sorting domain-containing protein, partial [Calditrichaeota bacterium]|nr:T9SS type A sorting domain-containing protein [Calditrichota bacterium]